LIEERKIIDTHEGNVSSASENVNGGRIPDSRRASIVLPDPGGPTNNTLCPPAAATSRARFAVVCPRTSLKSREEPDPAAGPCPFGEYGSNSSTQARHGG
jgi:hypothetical protein